MVGVAIGAAVGGAVGLASGGGLKGALTGAALGGATAGIGGAVFGGAGAAAGDIASGASGDLAGAGLSAADIAAGGDVASAFGDSALTSGFADQAAQAGGGGLFGGAGSIFGGSGGSGLGGLGTSSLISGGLNAAGQVFGSQKAAQQQTQANQNAIAAQQGFFNTTNANLQPFIKSGSAAANKIGQLEGLNGGTPSSIMSTLQSLPGYQFENQQGLKSVQNGATARGLGVSGAALKGGAAYSTGLANQSYNNFLTGLQNTENTGAGAAASLGSAATDTGKNIAVNDTNIGSSQGAASIATANAPGLAYSQIPNALIASSLLQQTNNQRGIY